MGTPNLIIQPLQTLQNSAARLVFRSRRTRHCTPLLRKFHRLSVTERIRFKVCCLCFKLVTGSAPVYLSKLLHVYTPSRTFRSSSDTRLFAINRYKRTQHGFRSFAHYGPHTWNDWPYDIKHRDTLSSFKNRLKVQLFSQCYSWSQIPVLSSLCMYVYACLCVSACACVA